MDSPVRAFGFVALTVPAVTLAHGVVGGVFPSATLMLLAAVVALVAGWSTGDRGPGPMMLSLAGVQLLLHGLLYFGSGEPSSACLPAIGRGARMGMDLALLRSAPACGPDGYLVGVGGYAAVAAMLLAVSLVVGQILVAALGTLALWVVEVSWAVAQSLVRLVSPIVLMPVQLTPRVPFRPAPLLLAVTESPSSRPFLRRGPPASSGH